MTQRQSRPHGGLNSKLVVTIKHLCMFLLGCAVTTTLFLNYHLVFQQNYLVDTGTTTTPTAPTNEVRHTAQDLTKENVHNGKVASLLDGVRILVAVVSYDFSQKPHLEEVLDAYADLCAAGSKVDVVVYSTVPWPVAYIDLLNSRFMCLNTSPRAGFSVSVHLKSPSLRLHLVDSHRELFYDRLTEYDLFIYTEDDIRVPPKTVATYLFETQRVREMIESQKRPADAKPSDFNIGIVRYEYNYPPDIIIDDNTRHATSNATRVYWEHLGRPAAELIPHHELLPGFVTMKNHHQGMYLATQDLLLDWRDRDGCNFNEVKNRPSVPGKPHQPSEGTQRVWMSSNQLFGRRHCNVQQIMPVGSFGSLTVLHLPNKNYRRVGRKGRVGGPNSGEASVANSKPKVESFEGPSSRLLTALQLHLETRQIVNPTPRLPYNGIRMENYVEGRESRDPLLLKRMEEYDAYVERGGVLSDSDVAGVVL